MQSDKLPLLKLLQESNLSDQKYRLLLDCFWAIHYADEAKVHKTMNDYYSNPELLEDQVSSQNIPIEIVTTGVTNELILNKVNCLPDDFDI